MSFNLAANPLQFRPPGREARVHILLPHAPGWICFAATGSLRIIASNQKRLLSSQLLGY